MDRVIPQLVSVEWLAKQAGAFDLRIVDCRWKLGQPGAGEQAYAQGHIRGAVFADVDRDLAAPPGERGRHPLPAPEVFAALMGRLGIADGTRVVAYDDVGGAYAARLWWLLRYFGHETGAVLDGGLPAWTAGGRALETAVPPVTVAEFHSHPRRELLIPRENVLPEIASGKLLLLDARAPERYRGDLEPIDPKPGHIPGALNAPFSGNLEGGKFLSPQALAERYRKLGVGEMPVAVYCGSGVTAAHDLLALSIAGFPEARLYPGSWSEWARDPNAPVETSSPARSAGGG